MRVWWRIEGCAGLALSWDSWPLFLRRFFLRKKGRVEPRGHSRGDAIVSHPSKLSTDIEGLWLTWYRHWQVDLFFVNLGEILFSNVIWRLRLCDASHQDCEIVLNHRDIQPPAVHETVPAPQKAIWRHTCGRDCMFYQLALLLVCSYTSSLFLKLLEKADNPLRQQGPFLPQQGSRLLLVVN